MNKTDTHNCSAQTTQVANRSHLPRFSHELDPVEVAGIGFSQCVYPLGTCLGEHAHENAILNLTLAGGWQEHGSNGTQSCSSGMVTFQPPRSVHRVTVNEGFSHGFHIEIPPGMLEPLETIPASGSGRGDELVRVVTELHLEYQQRESLCELAMECLTVEALSCLARCGAQERGAQPWLGRAADYLHEHYDQRVPLAQLAAQCEVSTVRLSRNFRRHYGVSPAHYQRRVRLREAARQIRRGQCSLVEVALNCGFSDQPHLTRSFIRWSGETPAAYQRRALGSN